MRGRSTCRRGRATLVALVGAAALACALRGPRMLTPAEAERLASAPGATAGREMPVAPEQAEALLGRGPSEVVDGREVGAGLTRPSRVTLRFPGLDRPVDFKWKPAPPGDADGWNNTPRFEVAAYALQKWFLEPADYVVPPTGPVCLPLDDYAPIERGAEPNAPGARCVFGILSLWLQHVQEPDVLYDRQRFVDDAAYARHLGHLNVFTYLIDHKDARVGNFLVSKDASNRRVFSIDNGIAFGAHMYNYFLSHWNRIRVPGVPARAVERLRRVDGSDLAALGVVAQLRRDEDGTLHPVPPGPNLGPDQGTRWVGRTLQLGLTEDEIEDVAERLEDLLERVDEGDLPTF